MSSIDFYGQITTTKIKETKSVNELTYDSLTNFLGENVNLYKGQRLYLKGLNVSLRDYGYGDFYLDYTIDSKRMNEMSLDELKKSLNNKYKQLEYNSQYSELAEKYFDVNDVIKHPEYKNYSYLKLIELESKDTVYFKYDSSFEHSFPFLVLGFYQKQEEKFKGKKYVLSEYIQKQQNDVTNGKSVSDELNISWKCVGVTIDEKYFNFSIILENKFNQKTLIRFDDVSPDLTNGIYLFEDTLKYINKFGMSNWIDILKSKFKLGWTEEMVELSLGKPKKINYASYGNQWVYHNQNLYFKNGILTSYN